jgi:hypothetical protein
MIHTMRVSRIFSFFLLLVLPVCVQAQGGSSYSIFGIGDIQENTGAVYDGLGGNSIAVRSPYALGGINPASWGFVTTTRLQTGFTFRQTQVSDNSTSLSQNNGSLQGIAGVFSIDTALGISVGFGFQPYSSVRYLINQNSSVVGAGQQLTYHSEFEGKGGMSTAYLGGTFRPFQDITVGISGQYNFGRISSTVTTTFNDGNYLPSALQNTDAFNGGGFTIGAMYTGIPNLTLGAIVNANASLSVAHDERYMSSITLDTTVKQTLETDMPLTLGFGATYTTGKFLFTGEVSTSDYSTLTIRKPEFVSFRRANRVSVGASRLANPSANTFLDRWAYNIGAGYRQLYYVVNDQGIDEIYGSFGVQLPVARSTYFDAAVTGGMRGTTSQGLIQEVFARLSFSISIGENWFRPFKRD